MESDFDAAFSGTSKKYADYKHELRGDSSSKKRQAELDDPPRKVRLRAELVDPEEEKARREHSKEETDRATAALANRQKRGNNQTGGGAVKGAQVRMVYRSPDNVRMSVVGPLAVDLYAKEKSMVAVGEKLTAIEARANTTASILHVLNGMPVPEDVMKMLGTGDMRNENEVATVRKYIALAVATKEELDKVNTQSIDDLMKEADKVRLTGNLPNGDPSPVPAQAFVTSRYNGLDEESRARVDSDTRRQNRLLTDLSGKGGSTSNMIDLLTCLRERTGLFNSIKDQIGFDQSDMRSPEMRSLQQRVSTVLSLARSSSTLWRSANKMAEGVFTPHMNRETGIIEVAAHVPKQEVIYVSHFARFMVPHQLAALKGPSEPCLRNNLCVSLRPVGSTSTNEHSRSPQPGMLSSFWMPSEVASGVAPSRGRCILCILSDIELAIIGSQMTHRTPTTCLNGNITFAVGTGPDTFPAQIMHPQLIRNVPTGVIGNVPAYSRLRLSPKYQTGGDVRGCFWEWSFPDFLSARKMDGVDLATTH